METKPMIAAHPVMRHPLDPDPVRSSKARTVFVLGLVGVLGGVFIGGLVAATAALLLARQARREAYASGGYLTGAAFLDRGERLARIGIGLAVTSTVIALVFGIVDLASSPVGQDYAPTLD